MKKYFISFYYEATEVNPVFTNNIKGFANTSKTSLKKDVSIEDIKFWEEEIANTPGVKKVNILYFKEIK